MKVLVTGGSGYFGCTLRRMLRERGAQVRSFDLVPTDDLAVGETFMRGDIRDPEAVRHACEGIEIIHHNVAQVPLAKDRHLFESVNVTGTENLLAAAHAAGVKKVVYTSSSAVFGVPERNPVTEDMTPRPQEAYGRAKYDGELRCRAWGQRGLDVSIVRPRTILGHGRLGIFQILFEWIREGANVPVLGRGDNRYQFVHADDLANACMLAGERAGAAIYHAGTDRFGTMREALEALCLHAGTGSRVKSVPLTPAVLGMKVTSSLGMSPLGAYHALMYGRSMYFGLDTITRELGWKPRWSNDEMLAESYDWYVAHREEVLRTTGASHHRSAVKQGVLRLVRAFL
ncbi:MAG: NAD-dependent epimerase/dehydratase family protein [Candidatus Eisenbacteria bacterium]